MKTLFAETTPEIIRTIGLYQPFCTLMLPPYNKVETRMVKDGKKPPFPLGRYVFYSTKKPIDDITLLKWTGGHLYRKIFDLLFNEPTQYQHGYILGIGTLSRVYRTSPTPLDEWSTFVQYNAEKGKTMWSLKFTDVSRVEPIRFVDKTGLSCGKQGIGFLSPEFYSKLKLIK